MKTSDLLRTALENLSRRKVRTALTTVGVIVGTLTIVAMVSLGVGVQSQVTEQFSALGLENLIVAPRFNEDDFFAQFGRPLPERPITEAVVEQWRTLPGVSTVTPTISLEGISSLIELDGQQQPVRLRTPLDFNTNPFFNPPQALAGSLSPVPGENWVILSQRVTGEFGDPRALIGREAVIILRSPRGEEQRFSLSIAGISNEPGNLAQVNPDSAAAMKSWWYNDPQLLETSGYDQVVVRASNIEQARNLSATLREQGYEVTSLELLLDALGRVFAVLNTMLASVGGLALFVASLGIVNTMLMAIYERTREIGTLKAIGASRADIRNLFMLEAAMIGLLGGLIGLLAGWLIGIGLNWLLNWYISTQQIPISGAFFVVPWWLALAALCFAAIIGILAGLYPATRAARLDPLIALRYE